MLAPLLLVLAAPSPGAPSPNVVLVTLDTVRADRMGFLGSAAGATPQLDDLEPRHYRANLLTRRILDRQGKSGEALPYLERAVEANAGSAEARAFLAEARERAKAQSLRTPRS